MKKIMILAAAVMLAAIANAAAVGWTCLGTSAFSGGGYSVFVVGINGVTGADQIKALVAAGGLSNADSYAFFKGGSVAANATKSSTSSGKSITYSGSGEDVYTAFIVMSNADNTKASFTSTANITLANDSTSQSWAFANQATNLSNNTFTVNTPEPTSGVLLLLGMAGLALKRKRA